MNLVNRIQNLKVYCFILLIRKSLKKLFINTKLNLAEQPIQDGLQNKKYSVEILNLMVELGKDVSIYIKLHIFVIFTFFTLLRMRRAHSSQCFKALRGN